MNPDYAPRHQANEASRVHAVAHRELWETHELELLIEGWEDDESTLSEIAELLGRTIEACRQKFYETKREPRPDARRRPAPTQWDRGWSSLEAMGY